MWSRDWPRPKMKEILLIKLEDLNVLEITRFTFQNLNLALANAVLNGDSKDFFYFLVIISYFCLVPVPLQLIYVVIDAKENPD